MGTLHGELPPSPTGRGHAAQRAPPSPAGRPCLAATGGRTVPRGVSEKQAAGSLTRPAQTRDDPQMRAQAREQRGSGNSCKCWKTRFQREPHATPWATATAEVIAQALARAELQLTHVVDMECRATLSVSLSLSHADLQAATDFTLLFPMELGEVLPQMLLRPAAAQRREHPYGDLHGTRAIRPGRGKVGPSAARSVLPISAGRCASPDYTTKKESQEQWPDNGTWYIIRQLRLEDHRILIPSKNSPVASQRCTHFCTEFPYTFSPVPWPYASCVEETGDNLTHKRSMPWLLRI